MKLDLSLEDNIETDEVIELYKANGWSSAEKPDQLIPALKNSDSLVTARISGNLVGIEIPSSTAEFGRMRNDVKLFFLNHQALDKHENLLA